MGNFYKNLCLVGPGQSDVAAALERHGRVAFVTPEENRMTVAFDLESDEIGDPAELGDLALTLSQDLDCPVLTCFFSASTTTASRSASTTLPGRLTSRHQL